ncbi:MAG: hypothetical protein KAX93_02350 [Flavobacterium sp.]|nr:hypothetical protein [Flavobacterium sp.]MBP8157196.1 hypothetical protein [Flavobacterium sp.]
MERNFNYSIHLKNERANQETIILKQVSKNNTIYNIFEFPKDDVDVLIETLFKSKNDIFDEEVDVPNNQEINPLILDTLVELFFSGIAINDLASQYNLSESLIKHNLERKGIVLFDEF